MSNPLPVVDLDFIRRDGLYDPRWIYTRAAGTGVPMSFVGGMKIDPPTNTPRWAMDVLGEQSIGMAFDSDGQNFIRNPRHENITAGIPALMAASNHNELGAGNPLSTSGIGWDIAGMQGFNYNIVYNAGPVGSVSRRALKFEPISVLANQTWTFQLMHKAYNLTFGESIGRSIQMAWFDNATAWPPLIVRNIYLGSSADDPEYPFHPPVMDWLPITRPSNATLVPGIVFECTNTVPNELFSAEIWFGPCMAKAHRGPTSIILPPVASNINATALADGFVINLADYGASYVPTRGTLLIALHMAETATNSIFVSIYNTNQNVISVGRSSAAGTQIRFTVGGVVTVQTRTGNLNIPANQRVVVGIAWDETGYTVFRDNFFTTVTPNPGTPTVAMTQLSVMAFGSGATLRSDGVVEKVLLFQGRLTQSEIQRFF